MVIQKEQLNIKAFFKSKRGFSKKLCISLPSHYVDEIRILAKKHKIAVSNIIEACVGIGLKDEYINSTKTAEEDTQ